VKRKLISEAHEYDLLVNLTSEYRSQEAMKQKRLLALKNKHLSDELRRSRRQSRKILQTFRDDDDDDDDDFSSAWDDDDKTMSLHTPKQSSDTNGLNIAIPLVLKTPRSQLLSKWDSSESDSDDFSRTNSSLSATAVTRKNSAFTPSPITGSFLNLKVPSLSLGEFASYSSPNILALSQRSNTPLDNADQTSSRRDMTNSSSESKLKLSLNLGIPVEEEENTGSEPWSSDSDDEQQNGLQKPNHSVIASISDVRIEFNDSDQSNEASVQQPEENTTSKQTLLNRYNDDDDDDDSWGGSEKSDKKDSPGSLKLKLRIADDDDSWGKQSPPPQSSVTPKNLPSVNGTNATTHKKSLADFCDDDEDTDNIGETVSDLRNSLDEDSDIELIQQEVIEQETLTVDDLIINLTNEQKLKETYLGLSNAQTQKFHSQLTSLIQKTNMTSIHSVQKNVDTMPDVVMEPNEWPTTREFYTQRKGQGVRVKYALIESVQTHNCGKLCNPLVKQFGSTDDRMEYVYPALIIGPFLLHWNPHHSLVIPKKMTYDLMIAQSRIHKISEIYFMKIDDVCNTIAAEIVKWNTTAIHELKKMNGQHFIDRILSALGLNEVIKKRGRVSQTIINCMNMLREEGKGRMEFELDPSVANYTTFISEMRTSSVPSISPRNSRYFKYFSSHQELDEFARKLITEDSNYTISRTQDYSLLILLDLVFWSKHMLHPSHPSYKPLKKNLLQTFSIPSPQQNLSSNHHHHHHDLLCPLGSPFTS
jgi:hypothetical protein